MRRELRAQVQEIKALVQAATAARSAFLCRFQSLPFEEIIHLIVDGLRLLLPNYKRTFRRKLQRNAKHGGSSYAKHLTQSETMIIQSQ